MWEPIHEIISDPADKPFADRLRPRECTAQIHLTVVATFMIGTAIALTLILLLV